MRLEMLRTRQARTTQTAPVVWAVDAFSKDFETHARTAHAIRTHAPESQIHPVYILSEEVFSHRGYSSFLRAALKPRAHHNLAAVFDHELLADLKKSGALKTPRVLIEASADAAKCTGKLLRYAKRVGAELVAAGTHGRTAFSRWFAGSFADTLMRESDLPLLIAGPKQEPCENLPKALIVPTDFRREDRQAFGELLKRASERDLAVHLFHRATPSLETWMSGVPLLGEGWVSVDALFGEPGSAREAKEWLQMSVDAGVETRFFAQTQPDSFAESILEYARKLDGAAPLIALLNAELPGRLARDLIRASPYPLFIAGRSFPERRGH